MVNLLAAKSDQAAKIMSRLGIDLWMIVTRESNCMADPSMVLVVGGDVVWTSFFMFSASGKKIALVGNYDVPLFQKLGHFTEVIGYTRGVREDLLSVLRRLQPRKIGINYSLDYHMADGIGHGLFLQLMQFLRGTPFEGMLVSSEGLISELRAIKLPEEVERIRACCDLCERLFGSLKRNIRGGMSGVQIYEFLKAKTASKGIKFAFEPSINIGTKTPLGHAMYTEDILSAGELLHIDFGIVHEGFCSDLQRLFYVCKEGESGPPAEATRAFETIAGIIREVARAAKPGVPGFAVDQTARTLLTGAGYPEYQHALGHQVGRFVHDGGTILGPRWERYGKSPYGQLQAGQVYTLELETILDGIGVVGLEEIIVVTPKGGKFLSKPQRRLVCV